LKYSTGLSVRLGGIHIAVDRGRDTCRLGITLHSLNLRMIVSVMIGDKLRDGDSSPTAIFVPFLLTPCSDPGERGGFHITPWADRVQLIDTKYGGTWELPAIGVVTAPTAVLVRPDGYVAWVGDLTQRGLTDALATWFGPPAAT